MEEGIIYQAPGHYFNYDHRLPCNGVVAAWNYCYYTAELGHSTSYWIRFQIWREINRTTILPIHNHHIHLEITEPYNTTFICHREAVTTEMSVEEGDFIAVNLPSSFVQPIPVVGQNAEGSRLYLDVGDSSTIIFSRQDGLALHVDAEIGKTACINMT